MVIQIEPVYRALQKIKLKRKNAKVRIVLLSTRGQIFDNRKARALAGLDQVIFICGRYEGVDERVASHLADEEISLGAFVLSGGELAAMVIAEAACRFIPGFLGKEESLEEIKGSYPVYTRPPVFELPARKGKKAIRWPVPDILLTGDHKKIEAWRNQKPSGSSR
jgi:tRNA (guanine37-N1)-methyltransferase